MTIKPVVAQSQKRIPTDGEKKETHSAHSSGVGVESQPSSLNQHSLSSVPHRNVAIEGHGQSPKRREVFEDITLHCRSPHKSARTKRRDHSHHHLDHHGLTHPHGMHLKRERTDREKHQNVSTVSTVNNNVGISNKIGSPLHNDSSSSNSSTSSVVPAAIGAGNAPPERLQTPQLQAGTTATPLIKTVEENISGYNSGDEHYVAKEGVPTADEWQQRDEQFAKCMTERGYILKPVEEDGACLFRAISLQIYGDEEMHDVIRQHTMDYIYKNREYFCHFVTEDINCYIKRKRRKDSHGNHIEIQAMSEIYSRPVEVYCYKPTPINIFNSEQLNNGYAPLRLSYQRNSHYNAIIDPYNATVGVGLGLAGYKPELQTKEAIMRNEQLEIEQTMFEDKLKTTDWEATNEAIEEQIARESYLQWCRDNLHRSRASAQATTTAAAGSSTTATITSATANTNKDSDLQASPSNVSIELATDKSDPSTSKDSTNSDLSEVFDENESSPGYTLYKERIISKTKKARSYADSVAGSSGSVSSGGYESDGTDSCGPNTKAGKLSPTSARRIKTSKSLGSFNRREAKKRYRERKKNLKLHAKQKTLPTLFASLSDSAIDTTDKSPKNDFLNTTVNVDRTNIQADIIANETIAEQKCTRAITPEAEQQPCTSKQSTTPPKNMPSNSPFSLQKGSPKQPFSDFYRDLLEASYATDGFHQLTESEMLQRAIQMSTQDYIKDQQRKYFQS